MGEKRMAARFKFRCSIQYERVLEDGTFSLPVTAPAWDISTRGISFYSEEKMELHSKLRISFSVLAKEKVTFIGSLIRMEIAENPPPQFLLGVKIEEIAQPSREKINEFVNKVNIYNVLAGMKFEDVVDIHFVAGYPPIIKKIGQIIITQGEPFSENLLRSLLLNILDEERYTEFIRNKEANFVFFYRPEIRFRVNLHMQQGKVEGVFRLVPHQIQLPSQLGLPPIVEKFMEDKKGLILVAGRTGSGKTTTLASMVNLLNNSKRAIVICIERPIEYIHTNRKCIIKQREVGRDTLSFSNASKNALRQNPDVLLIGEILDRETMEVAISAAETGMLVLSSIHAPDSPQALDRVVSFFPAELQKHMLTRLSLILRGIVTQDLIPRKDGKGLAVAAEVLVMNNAMRRVVREGDWKQIPTVIQTGKNVGMQSMRTSLEQYFLQGIIDGEYFKEYM